VWINIQICSGWASCIEAQVTGDAYGTSLPTAGVPVQAGSTAPFHPLAESSVPHQWYTDGDMAALWCPSSGELSLGDTLPASCMGSGLAVTKMLCKNVMNSKGLAAESARVFLDSQFLGNMQKD